jgi:hypothetical protein
MHVLFPFYLEEVFHVKFVCSSVIAYALSASFSNMY